MSNKKNIVSIIIPIYNSEKYLNRCLSSITEQTYSNIEIVLIDDGSTDDSLSICLDWKNKDDRILVFSKENGGQGSARNYGIKVSSGEYIVFVDSDDYIHPQMIEVLIHVAINHVVDIVQCSYQEVDEGVSVIDFDDIKLSEVHCVIDNDRKSRYLCWYTEDIIPVNKLIRKELLADLSFPLGMYYEDKHLMFRLRYYADTIATIDNKLYYYVQTSGSTMRQDWNDKRFTSSFRIINDLADFCLEHDLTENYKAELSGDLRKLLSLYYHASSDKIFYKYQDEVVTTLYKYLPDLKKNKYVKGKYKIIVFCLGINVEATLKLFSTINKFRLKVKK